MRSTNTSTIEPSRPVTNNWWYSSKIALTIANHNVKMMFISLSDLKSLTKLRLYISPSQDISKIVILTCGYMTGYELADLLREDFLIEVEASFPSYIIAMTGTGDTEGCP